MPLGFERLNERVQRPNKHINFIKPLEGPDKAIAQDILECAAAIVYPIMKKHHLYVMALEEFPPNKEFWGRNFNAGEVIQLVLKSPHNGMWLPMPMIQSVLLHELAHNKEMNHSRRFHKHRLGYVADLYELKSKGYSGEGFWGKGRSLHPSADLTLERPIPKEELPEELCGGVYKREKRKKAKDPKKKIDYQEQKRRRIIKKFGSLEGNAVGGDDQVRQELEKGKKPKGKPRVAGSARGRDLRAEAALRRFETQKKEEPKEEDDDDLSSTESEEEEEELIMLEDDETDSKAMLEEMSAFACGGTQMVEPSTNSFPEIDQNGHTARETLKDEDTDSDDTNDLDNLKSRKRKKTYAVVISDDENEPGPSKLKSQKINPSTKRKPASPTAIPQPEALSLENSEPNKLKAGVCQCCEFENEPLAVTCMVCSNVLRDDIRSWKCKSEGCRESKYQNSTDVMYCGVCGTKR